MPFENPFLQPSAVRKSAFDYLWSDEPDVSTGGSSPSLTSDTFTSPSNSANTIGAIATNILNNEGEFNADQGIDASQPVDPFDVLKAFEKYGPAIKAAANMFGLGSFASLAQQQASNDLLEGLGEAFGGDPTDPSNTALSAVGAFLGVLGVPLAGLISGKSKDAVEAAQGFISNFDTKEQAKGYIAAGKETADLAKEGYDTTGFISSIAGNLAGDDIASFGQKAYELQQGIDKGLASGQDLGQVQQELLGQYITPDTPLKYAIPTAVSSPALPQTTPLAPAQDTGSGSSYTPPAPTSNPNAYSSSVSGAETGSGGIVSGMFSPYTTPVVSTPLAPVTPLPPARDTYGGGYTPSAPTSNPNAYSSSVSGSEASGGGSSKIVCTAMNESYGFGSFRNKIWLAYASKHLSKEHEKGYHALFLPLVGMAYHKKTILSKPLRVVLEHVARHRSADLRAEMRGVKRDTLGRAYRAFLEPLCYFVGKYK